MDNFNGRTLLTIGVLMAVVVLGTTLTFSTMWAHVAPNGANGNGSYGFGPMMGPWMWGGMGFFWVFPVVGFLCMLIFFGVIWRRFFGNAGPRNSQP